MHDRLDALFGEDAADQRAIGDIAFVERHVVGHRLARAVRQIVNHRDAPPRVLQRKHRVAADVSGAAGDEDWDFAHAPALAKARGEFQRSKHC